MAVLRRPNHQHNGKVPFSVGALLIGLCSALVLKSAVRKSAHAMETSIYRREYASFCSEKERRSYAEVTGRNIGADEEPLEERYADLWARDHISDLSRALDETSAEFATERAALELLLAAAHVLYVEASARSVADELRACEQGAKWDEIRLQAAEEARPKERRALVRRALDALAACDDLRAERLALMEEAARTLGHPGSVALYERATRAQFDELAVAANGFLARTAERYLAALRARLRFDPEYDSSAEFDLADELRFRRLAAFDPFFPAEGLLPVWRTAVERLQIRLDQMPNLKVEPIFMPHGEARCFAVAPPDEVHLVIGQGTGLPRYASLFAEGGRALYFAWASRQMAARYPELIHSPDRAPEGGHAALFRRLWCDARWIEEVRGLPSAEARRVAHATSLAELHAARFWCVLAQRFVAENAALQRSEFAAALADATGFERTAAALQVEVREGWQATTELRALCFAVMWNERLRTRYGRAWWRTRGGRDELIDVWNVGARYAVEELAPLIGAGALDYDFMADAMLDCLGDED